MNATTRNVIDWFETINRTPRCSGQEAQLCRWLQTWATERGFKSQTDSAGNLAIRVPATGGAEHAPTVILQGHMDMVCEKREGSGHDFSRDPIRMRVDGDWLSARETTLGADNGIAIAFALALVADEKVYHPPLELLFTVEEETGLTGALNLAPDLISGNVLVNLDSEDEGVFVVGCAGGRNTEITRPLTQKTWDGPVAQLTIRAEGMQGGHSGVDIARHRANANTVMARLLSAGAATAPIGLMAIRGGTGRNVIPRACQATLACNREAVPELVRAITNMGGVIRHEHQRIEPDLEIQIDRADGAEGLTSANEAETQVVIDLLLALPSGPVEMTPDLPTLVQTSTNLSLLDMQNEVFSVITSQRSAEPTRLDAICQRIRAIGRLAGASVRTDGGYPPWPMDPDSALLKRCKVLYQDLFDAAPIVETIHAGLECGVIGDRYPKMDMISIGPTVENLHSPSERLYLPSVDKVWRLLVALMASFAQTP